MTTQVYIPTRQRWGTQPTLREFLSKSSYKPILVCPPDEVKEYRKTYPRVLGCSAEGIGPTRQWIVENTGADVVLMVDDDMWFSYRPDPTKVKLEVCEQLDPLVRYIEECVLRHGFVHGGVSARQGNNRKDLRIPRRGTLVDGHCIVDADRVNNFHWLNPKEALRLGARYDQLPVMEDFHFTLTLLTRGVPNRVLYDYVWNQRASSWRGGCSLYRTPQVQEQGARGLAAAFPLFVKVVTKTNKESSPAWNGMKEHHDVIIQWHKAYLSSGVMGEVAADGGGNGAAEELEEVADA
jgi:hypothetical protein